ncbi:sn-glycerol-3-phosphate ABC transporter ATP-binding protein UgpC [Mesorhizobium microcysteis]|uniref:sn-glycerol-3-phosphate ABC transporter ATP-binding protein UgpC n=1 Tax=Neoaquamicrobium microcysteis TaxID=2682781 RepID=A0A5D4H1S4_9HYPH|nr:sn-glycerol-3-phosphate ABC transporter ATP-binding protein UgpC [Mesorhizobium microcysteis]TYR34242.1 sn-glycerol-3-phosphate ABC transporter ATP-binding protein UgpC [Mesorhizobium microcysteis]
MAEVEITSVSKSFGAVEVLRDVNLKINSGEFVVFVGPSGCGKSTLLRMITGLETESAGDLFIDGQRVNDIDPAKRGTAMVFQSYALYPHMTVAENMGFGLKMAGEPKASIREKVGQAAAILRLEQLLERRPGQLSGGQKQRVAIGRAIVRKPKVFLFDEPLSNLDAELRVQMRAELIDLHRRLGATMIYVTHDQVEAMTLADRIVVMNGGVVQQYGRPLDLYDDPDNRFVAGFIGSPKMNFLDASVQEVGADHVTLAGVGGSDRTLRVPFRGFDASVKIVTLGVRPEHVRIGTGASSELPVFVSFAEELGDVTYIHGKLPAGTPVIARSDGKRHDGAENCTVAIDPAGMRLFDTGGRRLRESGA